MRQRRADDGFRGGRVLRSSLPLVSRGAGTLGLHSRGPFAWPRIGPTAQARAPKFLYNPIMALPYLLVALLFSPAAAAGVEPIAPDELRRLQLTQPGGFTLVDVQPEPAYRDGHILGAVNVPLEEGFAASVAALDKKTPVVVTCGCTDDAAACDRECRGAAALAEQGFERVRVLRLSDGLFTWGNAGYPIASGAGVIEGRDPGLEAVLAKLKKELSQEAPEEAEPVFGRVVARSLTPADALILRVILEQLDNTRILVEDVYLGETYNISRGVYYKKFHPSSASAGPPALEPGTLVAPLKELGERLGLESLILKRHTNYGEDHPMMARDLEKLRRSFSEDVAAVRAIDSGSAHLADLIAWARRTGYNHEGEHVFWREEPAEASGQAAGR